MWNAYRFLFKMALFVEGNEQIKRKRLFLSWHKKGRTNHIIGPIVFVYQTYKIFTRKEQYRIRLCI